MNAEGRNQARSLLGKHRGRRPISVVAYRFRLDYEVPEQVFNKYSGSELAVVILGDIVLALAAIYLFAGFAAALRFITVTAPSFSPRAQVGSLLFRAILIPGAALLWPVTLRAGAHGVGRPASPEPGHAEPRRADAGRGEGDA